VISHRFSDHKLVGVPPTPVLAERRLSVLQMEPDMEQSNNREYYRARAIASHQMARRASDPQIARIHENFARHYEDAIDGQRPSLRVVSE
jgi:hypothetical protein